MLLHFSMLKKDMPGEIRRMAAFLGIEIDETNWNIILEHCSFDYMKAHADMSVPYRGYIFEGGAESFMNRGISGRWRDVLTPKDIERYENEAERNLGMACAHWLATGEWQEG
jgi:aryl sulfotransferase